MDTAGLGMLNAWGQNNTTTLRDTFAAAALTGLSTMMRPGTEYNLQPIAQHAYEIADAMLAERAAKEKPDYDPNARQNCVVPVLRLTGVEREALSSADAVLRKYLPRHAVVVRHLLNRTMKRDQEK